MIRISTAFAASVAALALAGASSAQPAGITPEMIGRQLPEEGAPLAVAGPYEVVAEPAMNFPNNTTFRPADLSAFPESDTLPVLVWGNGGCAANPGPYSAFLETIASHGFLVVTSANPVDERGVAGPDDLRSGLDWAFAANDWAPLAGKIDLEHVAMMGVSCGGFLALANAADPRIDTIGMWNSGLQPPPADGAPAGPFPTTEALAGLHGSALYINGGEPDFMYAPSRANYDALTVPAFYGARADAGHSATYYHPGGGEFANVAVAWLKWRLKGDEDASRMFVGADCTLCTDPNWETASKGF